MKIKSWALLLLIPGFACAQKQGPADKRFAGIESELNKVLKASRAPGFAVAIVEKNKVVYQKGFGYRDAENKLPADTNTLFAIGSCTKAFTSSLIGLLQQEEKLDINKPVRNYLPGLRFFNDQMNDHITLRDMMCHRTGLPRHDLSWYLFTTSNRDSLLQRIQYMEPTYGLREKWQYNNFMFFAQGVVIEKLTGKSWEENMRQKLFVPLNMKSTNMPYAAVKGNSDLAVPYVLKKDSSYSIQAHYNVDGMGPAGAIYSTVTDMANWLITWVNGGKFNGKEILPPGYVNDATGSQMVVSPSRPDPKNPAIMFETYGFGWALSSYKSHYLVEHGGAIDGFSANTAYFPTDSIGIVVLTNQGGSWVPGIARNIIADQLLKLPYYDWVDKTVTSINKDKASHAEIHKNAGSSRKINTPISHDIKAYEGFYNHPGYGTLEIKLIHDSLFAVFPGKKIWLEHFHYDVFAPYIFSEEERIDTTERSNNRLIFNGGASGEISSIQLTGIEDPRLDIIFKRMIKPKDISIDQLDIYTGSFELGNMTMKFFIKGKALYASVPGQPEYELIPMQEKDKFSIKILNGYFVQFERNDKNEILAASFIQPNGIFKATKKLQ